MTTKQAEPVTGPRCHVCGGRDAAVWYPVRGHGIEICTGCYSALIAGAAHTEPFVPLPA